MAEEIKVVGLANPKAKGKTNWKIISAIIGIVVLSIGVIAGIFLVREQQDIREKASGNCDNPSSIVQCPRSDGALVSCNPPDSNGNAQISVCDSRFVGRTEVCGGAEYCCDGTSWSTTMTACAACNAKAPTTITSEDITATTAKLKWSGAAGGKLRLWVSTNSDPTGSCGSSPNTCVVNDKEISITTTEYEITGLKPNTKYYYRLMAWTRSGCDSAGSAQNFTTTADNLVSATPTVAATSTSVGKTATPTATSTSKATTTSTSKIATPTTKSTASGSGTPFPVPETGADIPTVLGLSFGVVMILISLGLAL